MLTVAQPDILYRVHQSELLASVCNKLLRSDDAADVVGRSFTGREDSGILTETVDAPAMLWSAPECTTALFVAPEGRQGVTEFIEHMAAYGFSVDTRGCPPEWTEPATYGIDITVAGALPLCMQCRYAARVHYYDCENASYHLQSVIVCLV